MAGLKQIMEIFMTINQPLSSEQRVRWYKQRKSRLYACPFLPIPMAFVQPKFDVAFGQYVIYSITYSLRQTASLAAG